jgi:microsomal dipeptidase-like Zn-dependent dipeptidase
VIADLHCHYPMHLVHDELEPRGRFLDWWDSVKGELQQQAFDLAAKLVNYPGWGDSWRVDIPGLKAGGVGVVCSVLYWPVAEFLPDEYEHAQPGAGSFDHLVAQLEDVEKHLQGTEHVIVTRTADLDDPRMRFVHCVEGGFHLGPDAAAMDAHVGELARRGVFYITLAHLFFRGVAANAPALPPLSDELYDTLFPQPDHPGLTPLGRSAVKAMVAHHVVVDLSHMRQDALDETFALLEQEDPEGRLPAIASHAAARSEGPDEQHYNLTPETMRRIKARGGVIGLILAQHQIGGTEDAEASRAAIRRHVKAIHDALGTHEHTAIGTDLDGFIKPTLAGLERAGDLELLERWISEDFPDEADAILHGNAERVLRRVFALRAGEHPA